MLITCHLRGGLGNQLFQIVCTVAYAMHYQCDFIFPYSETLTYGIVRQTYWDNLLSGLRHKTTDAHTCLYENKDLFHWVKLPENVNVNGFDLLPRDCTGVMLLGYFQNLNYFRPCSERIMNILGLREKQTEFRVKNALCFSDEQTSVSMHFRIGDYVAHPHVYNILSYTYYESALYTLFETVPSMHNVVCYYFCEKENTDVVATMVSKLHTVFGKRVTFLKVDDSLSDWEQMLFMSCCDHHIIANSTFSWWGAYLGQNPGRNVCFPKKWWASENVTGANIMLELIPVKEDNAGKWIGI